MAGEELMRDMMSKYEEMETAIAERRKRLDNDLDGITDPNERHMLIKKCEDDIDDIVNHAL